MTGIKRWTLKRSIGVVLIVIAMLIAATYGTMGNPPSVTAKPSAQTKIRAALTHAAKGKVDLIWFAGNQTLIAIINMSGLAPDSIHPAGIHTGDCSSPTHGDLVYGLSPLIADKEGKGISKTVISQVKKDIPGTGLYVDVHNGPQLTSELEELRIACANITNSSPSGGPSSTPKPEATKPPSKAPLINAKITLPLDKQAGSPPGKKDSPPPGNKEDSPPPSNQENPPPSGEQPTVRFLTLGGSADANQSANGAMVLTLDDEKDTLKVELFLFGLQPKTKHLAHIHSGSCEAQGEIVHTLKPVSVDEIGFATSKTTLKNVSSIPEKEWYVNVHQASKMSEMNTQAGFNPIACANVSK